MRLPLAAMPRPAIRAAWGGIQPVNGAVATELPYLPPHLSRRRRCATRAQPTAKGGSRWATRTRPMPSPSCRPASRQTAPVSGVGLGLGSAVAAAAELCRASAVHRCCHGCQWHLDATALQPCRPAWPRAMLSAHLPPSPPLQCAPLTTRRAAWCDRLAVGRWAPQPINTAAARSQRPPLLRPLLGGSLLSCSCTAAAQAAGCHSAPVLRPPVQQRCICE
jgi:hypothetical protein